MPTLRPTQQTTWRVENRENKKVDWCDRGRRVARSPREWQPRVRRRARSASRAARYLVTIGGCNDCHTPGYMEKGPAVPESEWLTGVPVGFQGPWGTTYPANLRIVMKSMNEAQWLKHARQERLPPMPWFNVAKHDGRRPEGRLCLRAQPRHPGTPAPAYVAPGGKVDDAVLRLRAADQSEDSSARQVNAAISSAAAVRRVRARRAALPKARSGAARSGGSVHAPSSRCAGPGQRSSRRRCSRINRASRFSLMSGNWIDGSRRSSRFEYSVRRSST